MDGQAITGSALYTEATAVRREQRNDACEHKTFTNHLLARPLSMTIGSL